MMAHRVRSQGNWVANVIQGCWWDSLWAVPGGSELKIGDDYSQVEVLVAGVSGFAEVRDYECSEWQQVTVVWCL